MAAKGVTRTRQLDLVSRARVPSGAHSSIVEVACSVILGGVLLAVGCGRTIEGEPPVPEHRVEPCEQWCAMIFDPDCLPAEVEVPDEEACVQGCVEDDYIWSPQLDGNDACAGTYADEIACVAALDCETQREFLRRAQCGPEARAPVRREADRTTRLQEGAPVSMKWPRRESGGCDSWTW